MDSVPFSFQETFLESLVGAFNIPPEHRDAVLTMARSLWDDLRQDQIPEGPPEYLVGKSLFDLPPGIGMAITQLAVSQQQFLMFAYIHQGLTQALARALEAEFGDNGAYLEIMAGAGWLAKGLLEADLHGIYIATDLEPPADSVYPVNKVDARDAIIKHRYVIDCYLLSWPHMDEDAAIAVQEIPSGRPVVYFGEWGGCCGTPSLFEQLEVIRELPPPWAAVRQQYWHWPMFKDQFFLCRKR